MDPFSMYITHADLPPPYIIPRKKKRLKQQQLELEKDLNYVRSVFIGVYCCVTEEWNNISFQLNLKDMRDRWKAGDFEYVHM